MERSCKTPSSHDPAQRPPIQVPSAVPTSEDELKKILRVASLRATSSRIAVLRYLQQQRSPISHAELFDGLTCQDFDRATVYRNLMDLTKAGLVSRADLGDHVWRFELAGLGGEGDSRHPHFVCTACGDVTCLPDAGINISAGLGAPRSVLKSTVDVQLSGVCDRC